jgi:predicted phosphodiesterase
MDATPATGDRRDQRRRGRALRLALPAALVALIVVASAALLAPASYRVPTGTVDFSLDPAWPGGRLVLPLGPAGVLALRTHRAPVDLVVDYRVSGDVTSLQEAEQVVEELPAAQKSARDAFTRFLWSRLAPLLLLGAAAGTLIAGGVRRRWQDLAVGAVLGLAAAAALAGLATGVVLATVDETPDVEYSGLAENVPRLLPLVRRLQATEGGGMERLQAYVDGLEIVAAQLASAGSRPAREHVTRLLVVSDVHMNAYGARLASRLAEGDGSAVDAVLLAGDMTNVGTRLEAKLFVDRFESSGAPVIMVGGNHEDAPAMKVFAKAGYVVLEYADAAVGGVTVYGVSDPLAYDPAVDSDVVALEAQSGELAARLAALPEPPALLAVHDRRQAEAAVAWCAETDTPLTVVYGNDHVPLVSREGPAVLVDAGTGGASGYEQIGAQRGDWYTFVLLDYSRDDGRELVAITTLAYSIDGRSRVEYLPMAE